MATHFVCQSTEPLPHQFSGGLGNKTHGAVSQYELYNTADKRHTQFPPPGWDFSLTSEEDSLPLLTSAPQTWRDSSFQPDPDLCLTPLRKEQPQTKYTAAPNRKPVQKTELDPDPLLALTPDKRSTAYSGKGFDASKNKGKKQKVRFDIQSQSETSGDEGNAGVVPETLKSYSPRRTYEKPYQPEIYGNDSDNEDAMLEKAKEALGISDNSRRGGYTVSKPSKVSDKVVPEEGRRDTLYNSEQYSAFEHSDKTQHLSKSAMSSANERKSVKIISESSKNKKDSTDIDVDPIAACRDTEPPPGPKRRVKVQRESHSRPSSSEYTFPFTADPSVHAGGEEHMFARPEYNSTLRMKLAAERLKDSEVDIEKVLQRKLKVSDNTRSDINEKASSHVNAGGQLYSGLVSLALPAEEICKEAVELKTARAKPAVHQKSKSKDQREPDVMEFFSSDRQKESVGHSLSSLPARPQRLSTASNWRAFDLYKHNRVWEGRGTKQ